MAEKKVTPEICANESEYTPFDLVQDRKRPTLVFVGAALLAVVLMLLGGVVMDWFADAPLWVSSGLNVLGIAAMAAPIMLCMIPIFGRPIDIGPVFTTYTVRVGDRLEEHTSRDYASQYSANTLFTFGKYIFMLLLSIVVTPIIAVICISSYSKAYKMAKDFADANGIPRKQIPGINPRAIKTVVAAFCVFFAIIFTVGLVTNENYASGGISQIKNFFQFIQVVGKTPEDYYGVSEDDGWVAAFEMDGGQQVYCGCAPEIGEYYIIEGTLYLLRDDQQWQEETDKSVKQKLLNRHLHTVLNGDYEYKHGEAWMDGAGMTHTFDNSRGGGILSISKDGVLKMYATSKNNGYSFIIQETEYAQWKGVAEDILG